MYSFSQIKNSFKSGISFGLASGAITTMGLMVGLYAGTNSVKIVIGGILTIAIADAFSDSLGIHIHEESENEHTAKEIWESTIATFISKLLFSLTFLVPFFLPSFKLAVIISILWGLSAIALLSYYIAKDQGSNPREVMLEHLSISVIVIILTYMSGKGINYFL